MNWRTGNNRLRGKAFQARLRRPLPPIVATEGGGWTIAMRAIFTPGMSKPVHVFADTSQPFPPLAQCDTHAERGDVKQAPSLMGSAVPATSGDASE